jgi:fused signal recognition particle receptor
MSEESENQGSGWWGSTLGKLKSALARTKGNLVDPLLDETQTDSSESEVAESPSIGSPQNFDATSPTGSPSLESQSAQAQKEAPRAAAPPAQMTATRPAHQRPAVAINEEYLEELEEKLIRADLGVANAEALVQDLRRDAKAKNWNSHDVESFLKKEFTSMLATDSASKLKFVPGKLNIYLVVGVNGTGKTTSIGKLAWRFKSEGKKVLMAAADTFRAAAESQLEIWSERAGVEIVRLADGADPGAVVYQALERAQKEEYDVLVIDTAGRLHNKANLMAELKKVRGVVEKKGANASLESLLVLDASTGQNGLQQAKVFTEVCPLTGVILTKLDGTAKGGVVFSINRELKIPVKLIGLGEKMDDLRDFEPGLFVEALFQR